MCTACSANQTVSEDGKSLYKAFVVCCLVVMVIQMFLVDAHHIFLQGSPAGVCQDITDQLQVGPVILPASHALRSTQ